MPSCFIQGDFLENLQAWKGSQGDLSVLPAHAKVIFFIILSSMHSLYLEVVIFPRSHLKG